MYPYSDGSPLYEFGVAAFLLAASAFLALTPARHGINPVMRHFAASLRRTGLFSSTINLSAEVHRLDLLRIAIGCMATWHYAPEFRAALAVGAHDNAVWFGITTILSACLALGFLTPLAATGLLLSLNILVVNYTLNLSIGSLAIAMCLIPMVTAPAGHTSSIDAVLLRRRTPVRALYSLWGMPTVDRVQIGRFLTLVAFAAINVYSALNHLGSQTWRDGLTTGTILLFPVIDPHFHEVADAVYSRVPLLYVALSKFTTYGMLVWQLALLPLVLLSRWTRLAAVLWGVIFFVFSAHILAIKTLGTYEYVLFVLVFWSRTWIDGKGRHGLMIFFDDRCNLCDRTVKTLGWLDLFHRLDFRPLSKNVELARAHGVSQDEALTDLVGVTPAGHIYRGYNLYQYIAGAVLLVLPLWPVLLVGRLSLVGPAFYRFIADRRTRLFGVCNLGSYRSRSEWTPVIAKQSSALADAIVLSFVVLLTAFVLRLPMVGQGLPGFASHSKSLFGRAPLAFGFGEINVFNEEDLKLYRNYQRSAFIMPDGKQYPRDFAFSETMGGLLTNDLRIAARAPVYCSLSWGDHIARFYAETLSPDDPARQLSIRTKFFVATHPSRDDLLSFRYAPLTWETTCTTTASIADPSIRSVEYSSDKAASSTANAEKLIR